MAPRRALTHERRVFLKALAAGLPAAVVALALLWGADHSARTRWTFTVLILALWWGAAADVRSTVVRPLQTLSNLLAALREQDFSFRARGSRRGDSLGEAMAEVNALADTLREQRLGALEATALLRKVMEEVDVAVFAFDGEQRLRLVNRAGEKVLGRLAERLLGTRAGDVGLADVLRPECPPVLDISFPGGAGRFEVRRGAFRQAGLPMQLLVLTDVTRALREEERQAWQRLIRVLGHELNNSLAPIKSIATSLEDRLARSPHDGWDEDMRRGLAVIAARSEALSRFMEAYSRLARLPSPRLGDVDVGALVRRVAGLETRVRIDVAAGPDVTVRADEDQLEQLLINLVRNAADAALETGGGVRLAWRRPNRSAFVELIVDDDGPGLPNTANLFVPFFTTKPHGSGIGLVLSRQIAEAHGGTLTLEAKKIGSGCRARLQLPCPKDTVAHVEPSTIDNPNG